MRGTRGSWLVGFSPEAGFETGRWGCWPGCSCGSRRWPPPRWPGSPWPAEMIETWPPPRRTGRSRCPCARRRPPWGSPPWPGLLGEQPLKEKVFRSYYRVQNGLLMPECRMRSNFNRNTISCLQRRPFKARRDVNYFTLSKKGDIISFKIR